MYWKNKKFRRKKIPSASKLRTNHYKELKKISPDVRFDPNTTYGKFVMSKLIPLLQIYNDEIKKFQQVINKEKSIENLIWQTGRQNELEFTERKRLAKEDLLKNIIKSKYPFTHFFRRFNVLICLICAITLFFGMDFNLNIYFTGVVIFLCSVTILVFLFNSYINKRYLQIRDRFEINVSIEIESSLKAKDISLIIEGMRNQLKYLGIEKQSIQRNINQYKFDLQFEVLFFQDEDKIRFILSDDFYRSTDWKKVRSRTLKEHENICVKCYSETDITVDHIKPRSLYPELALDYSNTQILCRSCNSKKGVKSKFQLSVKLI